MTASDDVSRVIEAPDGDEVAGAVGAVTPDAANVNVTGEAPNPIWGTPAMGWPSIDALTTTLPSVLLETTTPHVPVSSVTHHDGINVPTPESIVKSTLTPETPV